MSTIISQLLTIIIILGLIYYIATNYLKTNHSEPFIAPAYPENGIAPLILRNNEELPIIQIHCLYPGSASHYTARMIRKLVFPVDLTTHMTQKEIAVSLGPDELAILREQDVLARPMDYVVCAPLFVDVCIALASKETLLSNITDILSPKPDGTQHVCGIITDSIPMFQVICKNRNIRLGLANAPFRIIEYPNPVDAFIDLGQRKLDMIFYLAHPKDTVLQSFCATQPVRLLDIYPQEQGAATRPDIPYNPEDQGPTTQFSQNMKRDIPWLFTEHLSIDKIPNASLSVLKGASRATGDISIPRYVYNTFKVRNMLVYRATNPNMPAPILNNTISSHMPGLASRLVR
jgi:hypothetical protein